MQRLVDLNEGGAARHPRVAGKGSSNTDRIARYRIQLPRVRESLVRMPESPHPPYECAGGVGMLI